jgi:hypothetical protein
MSLNFNCSYMAMSSLTYTCTCIPGWTIEEMSIFSNSSHLEWRVGLSDIIVKGTLPARFCLIGFSGFRGKDLNVILAFL